MIENLEWLQDGADKGWFYTEKIGSVRSAKSYRRGGWWFLPNWLPDDAQNDVGPFRTKALALAKAEWLAAQKGQLLRDCR